MRVRLLKILDATAGFFLCWATGYCLHLFKNGSAGTPRPTGIRELSQGRAKPPAEPGFFRQAAGEVRRILVIRPGGMGDMILLQPMLKSLRQHYPAAKIDLVCEKRNREIPTLAGASVRVLLYDAFPFRLLFQLWRGRYDIAIDAEQFHYFSAVMAMLSRAPVRVGFKINPGRNTLYTHLVNYNLEGYEAAEFMRLLVPLGIQDEAVVQGCLTIPGSGQAQSRSLVIHVGASTRYKHWENGNTVELVKRLSSLATTGDVILVGGRSEALVAERIAQEAAVGDRVKSLAGRLTLQQTAEVIGHAALFIGGDSGLAHLAVALGTPTVVMFGPSDHKKWGVESSRNVVVRKALACAPCFIFGYHKFCHSIACMSGITVDDVMAGVSSVSFDRISSSRSDSSSR